jgi:tRNA modification GTPase
MMNKVSGWDDTIVALATPPGIGAIGVIRLSGRKALDIIDSLFPSKNIVEQPSHTIHVGLLKEGDTIIDEVVVSLFKGTRSYTGENVVEISCHGSPYIQQQAIQACLNKGARLAKPGEFTQRAFLHGKLDLTQAEAVADLISSNTGASHRSAIQNIRGGFSQVLRDLREQLIKFSALIELELDFSQEDVEFADRSQLYRLVKESEHTIGNLLSSFKLGNVIKNGVQVAIVGKPNAGKSTLLNTLLNENRAIVSEIAGTTRDTIEEVINIDGILFRLVDTAGIREHTSGSIESMGIEKSLEKIAQSDIVMYLYDVNTMPADELQSIALKLKQDDRKFLLVANKSDLITADKVHPIENDPDILFISAKINHQIESLKERLVDMVMQGKVQTEDIVITNARHFNALREMNLSLQDIQNALDTNIPSDLVALDIRRCLHFLGEITGEITNEDQLDYIFSKFCIGK